jgi:hypothetical protein
MKNYIGRKCKGFRFEGGPLVMWVDEMENYIDQIGYVVTQGKVHVTLKFDNDKLWSYPISLIEEHLIPETPEIPQLGEGVEMEVSNDHILWYTRNIIAQMQNGWYITNDGTIWKHARPIQEVKKYTKEELVKILGHDFEMV